MNMPTNLNLMITEAKRPWKLLTLVIGMLILIVGAYLKLAPDWDIAVSFVMAFFAYLTAGWTMHVLVERQWKNYTWAIFFTWWTIDGCYSVYWLFTDPQVLDQMRVANAPVSLCFYLACGLVWYWNGSLKEGWNALVSKNKD